VIGIKCRNSLPQGRIQDFKLGGAHLKKLRRAEEGANILGVFRAKNHYFTPKNHSFYNYGGRREKCWGISCEKSRFYAKKTYLFSNFRGGARRVPPSPHPPLDPPLYRYVLKIIINTKIWVVKQRCTHGNHMSFYYMKY
jgi:hypothetical protein